jgi:hypothetical protein
LKPLFPLTAKGFEMRAITESPRLWASAQTPHAAKLHFLFKPLTALAEAMEAEPRESRLEYLGESLARAAMRARDGLAESIDEAASPLQMRDCRRASALLTAIAMTGLLAGRFRVAFDHCAPGGYSRELAPGPREALTDLMSLCDWAQEIWPEPRWMP